MNFPLIIWKSPFRCKGLLSCIFHFYSNFNRTFCKQTVKTDQMPQYGVSDLGLHCLHMFHKKDARLIWVKHVSLLHVH